MSAPGRYEIQFWKGDSWSMTVSLVTPEGTPIDLTGWSVAANVYRNADTTDTPLLPIDAAVGADGLITLSLTAVQTASLSSYGVWDLKLFDEGGQVRTVLAGPVTPLGV